MRLKRLLTERHSRCCLSLMLVTLTAVPLLLSADRKPAFVDPVIRLAPNTSKNVAVVSIKVDALTDQELQSPQTPTLVDKNEAAPTMTFQFIKSDTVDKTARIWYFNALVDGLPSGQTQKRIATFQFGSITAPAEYTLTNQPTAGSNWTVLPPPDPWVLSGNRCHASCVAVSIIPGDAPATSLGIQQSTLVEQTTKRLLGVGALKLCDDPGGAHCGNGSFDLAPHYAGPPLYFCVDPSFRGNGNYRGTISLTALEKPESQAVTLDIYASSTLAKIIGFVLILLGVFGAWVVKVLATNRLTRDQELMPVVLLQQRLASLQSDLGQLPAQFQNATPQIAAMITNLLAALAPANLEVKKFIHPATPNPFAVTIDSAGLNSLLTDTDTKTNLLTVLVEEGVKPAVATAAKPARPADPDIVSALKSIDTLLAQNHLPTEAAARATITQTILPTLAATIPVAAGAQAAGAPAPTVASAKPVSFDGLRFEVSGLSLLVWAVASILTALVGLIVLILNNPGFGNPVDFIYCIFWGFGIPAALQQLAPTTASNALGISVAKT